MSPNVNLVDLPFSNNQSFVSRIEYRGCNISDCTQVTFKVHGEL